MGLTSLLRFVKSSPHIPKRKESRWSFGRLFMGGPRNRVQLRTTVYYKCFPLQSEKIPFKYSIVQRANVYLYLKVISRNLRFNFDKKKDYTILFSEAQ